MIQLCARAARHAINRSRCAPPGKTPTRSDARLVVCVSTEVDGFGRPVRCAAGGVEGEDLVTPAVDGVSEAGDLRHVGVDGVLEEHEASGSTPCVPA